MKNDAYLENNASKIPALELLQKLGYKYLSSKECESQRYGEDDIIESGFKYLMMDIEYGELDEDYLSIEQYNAAVKKYGELGYDECFGYVPLLALGGKESVDNLKKVKMKEHIELIYNMVGGI